MEFRQRVAGSGTFRDVRQSRVQVPTYTMNVLVIDDTAEVRQVIVQTLASFGFSAREAADGKTGIELALARRPNLIICDVRMPGLDGFQTLSEIRNRPEIASVPFIFLTAAVDKNEMRRGMSSGADDYLTKPFTPEELMEAVTSRLARQAEMKFEAFQRADRLREDMKSVETGTTTITKREAAKP